ncbi:MAG: GNAT family N-acetyltransferase [Thermoplasmata archaeon]
MSPERTRARSSSPEVTIRRISDRDRDGYRALRLRALKADPLAFGSTWSRESAYEEVRWTEWTHRGATSSEAATWLAESAESELVGMAGIFWEKGSFAVWGMWVDPRRRGTGIGTRLLQEVLRWAATARPEASVRLSVNPTQSAAVRLYRTCGFRSTGKSDPLGHTPGAFVEEMVRPSQGSRTSA